MKTYLFRTLLRTVGLLALASLITCPNSISAQTVTCWGFGANTFFTDPANWTNGVPGENDTAKFFVGVPFTVTMNVNATVNEFDHVMGDMTLNGGNQLKVTSPTKIDNELTVTGFETALIQTNDLNIGEDESGQLTIQDSSMLVVEDIFRVARGNVGGEFSVQDSGTIADIGQLRIGSSGTGIMQVSNAARVLTDRTRIGFNPGSIGNASISGADSLLRTSTNMNLGHFGGTGTLNILSGTATAGTEVNIGNALDSTGNVNMFGGVLESPEMFVGKEGDGDLDLRGGTGFISSFVTIADGPDATGTANVILSGRLETESLVVANEGSGMLGVSDGGVVDVDEGILVGANAGSIGSICIGTDGTLNCGFLTLGGNGAGDLIIEENGEVDVDGLTFVAPNFDIAFQENGGSLTSGLGLQVAGRVFFSAGDNKIVGDVELTNDSIMRVGPTGGSIGRVEGSITNNGSRTIVPGGTTLIASGQVTGTSPFEGTGLIRLNGGLSPGNGVGSIEFECDADFGAGAQINIELGGTIAGSQYDQVRFNDISLSLIHI